MKNIKAAALMAACMLAMTACGSTSDSSATNTESSDADITSDTSGNVAEDESKTEEFTYRMRGDNTIEIDGYEGTATKIIIPEEIDGYTVEAISGFQGNENITYVSIPSCVKVIEKDAFYDCDSLTQVDLSDGLEEIKEEAFSECDSLKEFNMPDTVTSIGETILAGSAVESIHISTGLETLSAYCFGCCDSLNGTIEIPENIKVIEAYAFSCDTNITEVIIGNNVEIVGDEAFGDCSSLTKAVVPSSVTELNAAFRGSSDVTLYVEAGSYAESYAIENEMKYEVQ